VRISPSGISFGQQAVQTASAPQTVTLFNGRNLPLNVTGIAIGRSPGVPGTIAAADFSETDTCIGTLAAQASCNVAVNFAPGSSGLQVATLEFHDDLNSTPELALLNPQRVTLVGRGLVPLTISAKKIAFGRLKVGKTTGFRKVRISNHLKVPVALNIATSGSDFSMTNYTCGNQLQPKKSCRVGVAFHPGSAGTLTGTVTITDNANGVPLVITLSGKGK
jgi:hypothetical protein